MQNQWKTGRSSQVLMAKDFHVPKLCITFVKSRTFASLNMNVVHLTKDSSYEKIHQKVSQICSF